MEQLILPFPVNPLFRFDNLVLHEGNELAVSTITSVFGTTDKILPHLFLYGPSGTGKTHVLKALAEMLRARMAVTFISAHDLKANEPGEGETSRDLETTMGAESLGQSALVIDDVHLIAAAHASALWIASNKLTTAGLPLILSSLMSPQELFEDNLHLRSRVTSGLVLRLDSPSDSARMLVLDKMARDRNIRLPPEVGRYLVNHKSRGLHDLAAMLERLDVHALTRSRRITLPFIRDLEKEGLL
ncbi:MAG: HdaA/DnaA family protein [Desulfomonilaceae bacterium]